MARTNTSGTAKATPDAVKAQGGKSRTRSVPAGTVEGPRGRRLKDDQQATGHEVPVEQRQGERRQAQDNAVAQFSQSQMTTPAAHPAALQGAPDDAEAAKQQAFMDAVAKMAESMGVPAPVFNAPQTNAAPQAGQRAPRNDRESSNGVTRPAKGTVTGQIWDIADAISVQQNGQPAAIADVRAHKDLRDVNDNTIKTQYARWRQFHGIRGRQAAPNNQVQGQDHGIEQAYNGPERRQAAQ